MTYIEFFDAVSVENIATCLSYMPDEVVIIGDSKPVKARIKHYERVFADRGHPEVKFTAKPISRTNLNAAVQELRKLVESYEDCVFDITGGDEVLVLALGMVCATSEKKIQVHKINLRSATIYDCDCDGETVFHDVPQLSVVENIRIYGGDVVKGNIDSADTYDWELTEDFCADVDRMWRRCRNIGRNWNIWVSIFKEICNFSEEKGLSVSASIETVEKALQQNGINFDIAPGFIDAILKEGLLTHYKEEAGVVSVGFKNEQIKRCLTIEGQVLELKMYIIAKRATEGDTLVYNDAMCGVKIDWDADIHVEEKLDVENEIDILLMHGVVPVFVSCKNGGIDPDELYKLHTVARRFGGPYAKMVLIAPALENLKNGDTVRRRAQEMGIRVLDGEALRCADDEELTRQMKCLWLNS